ncbi:MAG: DUF4232 domain-containing protein [Acidimicrobiales bacterium]
MRLPNNCSPRFLRTFTVAVATSLTIATMMSGLFLQGSATSAGATTSTTRCTTGDLVVWLNTTGNGAAGSSYYNLEFTNLSSHACTIDGYPGVSAVNLAGQQLGNAAGHNSQHPPALITLSSGAAHSGLDGFQTGATATVVLQITDAGNYPKAACLPVAAAGLRVYPPDQTASKFVPFPFASCSHRGPLILHVESAQKGVVTQ